MNKRNTCHSDQQQVNSRVQPAADPPDLQSQPPPEETKASDTEKSLTARSTRFQRVQQIKVRCPDCDQQRRHQGDGPQRPDRTSEDQQSLPVHGLSVERYRVIYNSVLQPSVLAALSSSRNTDYISQVLELKQRLWRRLTRPRLVEQLMEDGRVEVTEILDLTSDLS